MVDQLSPVDTAAVLLGKEQWKSEKQPPAYNVDCQCKKAVLVVSYMNHTELI